MRTAVGKCDGPLDVQMAALGVSEESQQCGEEEEEDGDVDAPELKDRSESPVLRLLETSSPQIFVMQKRLEQQQQQGRRCSPVIRGGTSPHTPVYTHHLCDPTTSTDADCIGIILEKALERRRRRVQKNLNRMAAAATAAAATTAASPSSSAASAGNKGHKGAKRVGNNDNNSNNSNLKSQPKKHTDHGQGHMSQFGSMEIACH